MRALLAVAALLAPGAAEAHHVAPDFGADPATPRTVAELDATTAEFDLGARSGSWALLTAGFELALADWLSAAARVPVGRVAYDDGTTAMGLSDVDLSFKLRAYGDDRVAVSAGSGLELPTGDDENGLGGGHVEVSPFVAGAWAISPRASVFGVVADRASVAGHAHHHDDEGSVVAPHAANELVVRAGAAYALQAFYGSAGAEAIWILSDEDETGPWALRAELGWLPAESARLAFGVDVPFAGDARFAWRARLGVALRL